MPTVTYRALVGADGTLRDLKSFVERGAESVAVDGHGDVYIVNGQIFVYNAAGRQIGRIDRSFSGGTTNGWRGQSGWFRVWNPPSRVSGSEIGQV
ncbi:MAG: hypothetical protein ABSH50_21830 [Bryobacteraceae bacterium]